MCDTTAPILQIGESGTMWRNEGLNVCPRYRQWGVGTCITWVPMWSRAASCPPFPGLYRDYPSAEKRKGTNTEILAALTGSGLYWFGQGHEAEQLH